MREFDDAVLECFLDKQLQLFPESVAETLDEAEDFLEECMAVVVDSVDDVIESLFGKGYFDVVQGQVDGVPIKPDPAGVFRILDQFGLTADEVLYMGDTATDMKTGKAAGAFTVGVLWGFRDRKELEEGKADAIIAHPLELLNYCE